MKCEPLDQIEGEDEEIGGNRGEENRRDTSPNLCMVGLGGIH